MDWFYFPLPDSDPRAPAYARQYIPSGDDKQAIADRIGAVLQPEAGVAVYAQDGTLLVAAAEPEPEPEPEPGHDDDTDTEQAPARVRGAKSGGKR